MKKIIVSISFLCSVLFAQSQNLTVEGTAPNLYITHTVAPKENFYSVGRLYNQTPKSIASFNNVVMEKGLTIGQRIKIPLNEQNLDASGNRNSGESIALNYVVAKGETLSKIGTDLNVSTQTLKQWNKLSSDNIAPGTPLIVGHLKLVPGGTAKAAVNTPVAEQPAVAKQETVAAAAPVTPQPKQEEASAAAQTTVAEKKEQVPAVQQEPAKQAETAATTPAKEAPAKMEETKKTEAYSYSNTTNNLGSIEGVFANVFSTDAAQKSITSKSGEAATFKSTSGWQDKKYYILMNEVAPGTIVKIASMENKVVYAKVLGSMPDMKENNGLLLRISNSAASYLGIIDPKFPVQISYYQ